MTSKNPATLSTVNHLRDIAYRARMNLAQLEESRSEAWLFTQEHGELEATISRLWNRALAATTEALTAGEVERGELTKL